MQGTSHVQPMHDTLLTYKDLVVLVGLRFGLVSLGAAGTAMTYMFIGKALRQHRILLLHTKSSHSFSSCSAPISMLIQQNLSNLNASIIR